MVLRCIPAVIFCLLATLGCGIFPGSQRPEIYGRFEKTGPLIRDTVTGLQWRSGPDRDMNWHQASAWVDSLGDSWRMPELAELRGLWNAGVNSEDWGPFENGSGWIWSGDLRDSVSAWNFVFHYGLDDWHYLEYSSYRRVFAVRTP